MIIKLSEYFASVDKAIEAKYTFETKYRINVCGNVLEFHQLGIPEELSGDLSFNALKTDDFSAEADAHFYILKDDCYAYIPVKPENPTEIIKSQDETGLFLVYTEIGLFIGADFTRKHFYCCMDSDSPADWNYMGKYLAPILSNWANLHGLTLFHSAVVGTDGKGILLAARGGGGKSTLSTTCLFLGMDFIADDYTLLTMEGELTAHPLYSIVAIRPDMIGRLPIPDDVRVSSVFNADGKYQLDLRAGQLASSLSIRAIVYPKIAPIEEPIIRRVRPGALLTTLVYSSAVQLGRAKDAEYIRHIVRRLAALPFYEIQVCPDLMKNPEALRKFIKEEL